MAHPGKKSGILRNVGGLGEVLGKDQRSVGAKGLEFDTVILVAPKAQDAGEVTPLYIGVSRAVSELVVVGSPAVADRLGIS